MSYFNYDDWKLANPEDSGFYTEEKTDHIEETTYFKYRSSRWWIYGMINKAGIKVTVHMWSGMPVIDIDEIEPTREELNEDIYRMRKSYDEFAFSNQQEFIEHYDKARNFLDKIMQDEKDN